MTQAQGDSITAAFEELIPGYVEEWTRQNTVKHPDWPVSWLSDHREMLLYYMVPGAVQNYWDFYNAEGDPHQGNGLHLFTMLLPDPVIADLTALRVARYPAGDPHSFPRIEGAVAFYDDTPTVEGRAEVCWKVLRHIADWRYEAGLVTRQDYPGGPKYQTQSSHGVNTRVSATWPNAYFGPTRGVC